MKACLVWWLVKLHFFHYYWPRYERGGNHTQWLMPISLHKSFPECCVYCLSAIKQRPKSSAKCTLFQGKKNLMLVDWKQQKFSCWRELKSINFLCKFHFMKQTLTIYNFHMKYLSFSNRLCNFSKSNQTVNYKLKDSWKGPGTVVNLSETC